MSSLSQYKHQLCSFSWLHAEHALGRCFTSCVASRGKHLELLIKEVPGDIETLARGKPRGTSGRHDSCSCPSSKLPHAPDHGTSASPQDGHISSSCPRTCPNTSNAMSSPCSPISRLIPRVSRRRTRCDGRGGGSSRAGTRWMSSTRDAQTKRPKTAIFFPGTKLHHIHVVSAMAD